MNDRKPTHSERDRDAPSAPLEQSGTHPLGTAAGAVGGAVAGALGGLAAGPVGSLAGAIGGAIAGGALGSGGTPSQPVTGPGVRAEESVAGEEDPGASIDLAMPPGGATPQNPGDEAPAGSPGTGEAVCGRCGGSGRLGDAPCPDCGGTGKVVHGIGGA